MDINLELNEITKTTQTTNITEDAISALSNLGFTRSQSFETVMKIVGKNPNIDMNDLIKLALKEINNF